MRFFSNINDFKIVLSLTEQKTRFSKFCYKSNMSTDPNFFSFSEFNFSMSHGIGWLTSELSYKSSSSTLSEIMKNSRMNFMTEKAKYLK